MTGEVRKNSQRNEEGEEKCYQKYERNRGSWNCHLLFSLSLSFLEF